MRLNGKFVSQLTNQDIVDLVKDGREEDQSLDFKIKRYSGGSPGAELAKDVIGLANGSGGVLLIGIEEKGERAVGAPGIALENGGRDPMESYERMIRDRIEPPIQGIQIKAIPMKDGKHVIAIGVPMSVGAPHRTKIGGEGSGRGRWAIRRNRNTDDMTYNEIRGAFLDSADIERRVRRFHAERAELTLEFEQASNNPANLGVMLLHVIPLSSEGFTFNIGRALNEGKLLYPPGHSGMTAVRPDLDGLVAHLYTNLRLGFGWAKLYRDGRVEGVVGGYVKSEDFEGGKRVAFQHESFVRDAHLAVCSYIEALTNLGFNPPFIVALSLINARGSNLFKPDYFAPEPLVSRVVTFDPAIIDQISQSKSPSYYWEIKSIFDQLWNAFGLMECNLYDRAGNSLG